MHTYMCCMVCARACVPLCVQNIKYHMFAYKRIVQEPFPNHPL